MSLTRRKLLQISALMGTGPVLSLAAGCGDDDTAKRGAQGDPDTGVDPDCGIGPDADVDADPDADGDVAPDVEPEPEEVVPDDLPQYSYDGPLGPVDLFAHGVASGDPLADAVVLWTRVTLEAPAPTEVWWEIAQDADFERRIQVGTLVADGDRDYTAKIDVQGLRPGSTYYYRFFALGRTSSIGRTRTAPRGNMDRMRFAVVSCSNLVSGYFHAYRSIAARPDLDVVVHLGDYIYEYGGGSGDRAHDPPYEIVSLSDYRRRYANYRRDEDLQSVHRQHPFIAVWDDHESANNSFPDGAQNHDPATEGDWAVRKAAAQQAWFEWMPTREPDQDGRIWRHFQFGGLVDLIMLDTRLWGRDEEAPGGAIEQFQDPARTILGDDQEAWFHERLRNSTAQWKIIGQQVMVGQFQLGGAVLNPDQWDGYQASRERFFNVLKEEALDDVVVLTGDIHSSWAMDLAENPYRLEDYDPATGQGSLAVEFVGTSVTSSGAGQTDALLRTLRNLNPHMKWVDLQHRGYVVVDVTRERTQGAWMLFESVAQRDSATEFFGKAWSTATGENRLVEDAFPAGPVENAPALAP